MIEKIGSDSFIKNLLIKKKAQENAATCKECGEKKCYVIDGKEHQPCPQCQISEINKSTQIKISKEFYLEKLDKKYRSVDIRDYKIKELRQTEMMTKVKDYLSDYQDGKWCILFGSQGTGKTMIKNCILKELGSRGFSFQNVTAMELYTEWRECNSQFAKMSMSELVKKYTESDILAIDEVGRHKDTQAMRDFLFELTDIIYLKKKTLILITNLYVSGEKNSIYDFIDGERIEEQCHEFIPFFWGSYRGKK